MQHQEDCPFNAVAVFQDRDDVAEDHGITEEELNQMRRGDIPTHPCPDRRCCVWLDLYTWFGFNRNVLSELDFAHCFTDLGHGGSGVYERLVVLGAKSLEMMATLYISEKYNDYGIPFDLKRMVPPDILRKLWTQKRVERVCNSHSLWEFGKSYLSTAQSMPTQPSIAKFVKSLFGFAVQTHALSKSPMLEGRKLEIMAAHMDHLVNRDTSIIYEWATVLIDNIYWIQKHKGEGPDEQNELIQDLQEYFGYPYETLIPRIDNVLTHNTEAYNEWDFEGQVLHGQELLQLVATNYFVSLSEQSGLPVDEVDRWLDTEVKIFMRSAVVAIFASTSMNLLPFLEAMRKEKHLPGLEAYGNLFYQLMLSSYIVTREDRGKIWLGALMHRLRQIQLILHMEEIDTKMYGPLKSPLALFQGVDIFRWSTIAQWHREWRSGSWMQRRRPVIGALPVSEVKYRRKIRSKEKGAATESESLVKRSASKAANLMASLCFPENPIKRNRDILVAACPLIDAGDGTPTQRMLEPKQEEPVCGSVPDLYYQHWRSNKKYTPGAKGTVFGRVLRPLRDARAQAAENLQRQSNGTLWRPPGAWFMQPRVVNFRKGEAYVSPWLRRNLPPPSGDGDVFVDWNNAQAPHHTTSTETSESTSSSSGDTTSTAATQLDGGPGLCSTVGPVKGLYECPKEMMTDKVLFSENLNDDYMLQMRKKDNSISADFYRKQQMPSRSTDFDTDQPRWAHQFEQTAGVGCEKILGIHMMKGGSNHGNRLFLEHEKGATFETDPTTTKPIPYGARELSYSVP